MSSGGDRLTLERFLRELPMLDMQQLLAISAAHEGASRDGLERAREAAGQLARAEGVLDELHELHGTIVQWTASEGAQSRIFTRQGAFERAEIGMLHDVREQVRPALLDAATALFLEEWLSPADRLVLLDPVDSVMA
ncbi:MAG TPA: hypothetical protein VHL56_10000 [Candidatus Limnocylindrales bacterium]|nr:hypothetical protein [Candidatus Limnocylindrales bacterium]